MNSDFYNLKYLTRHFVGRAAEANVEWRVAQFEGTDEEKEAYIKNRLNALEEAITREMN